MKTKTEVDVYNGKNFIKLFEVDEKGESKKEKPVISFGLKKAKAIMVSLKEIAEFIEENDK